MHILVTICDDDHFINSALCDLVVCAKILPDNLNNHDIHDKIKHNMIHGPCGTKYAASPCMVNEKCTKIFFK